VTSREFATIPSTAGSSRRFRPPLEVVGDAGRDGLAGDLLGALAGEENEGELRARLADRLRGGQAVQSRHVVVADDAVDPRVGEPLQRRPGAVLDVDGRGPVGPLQLRRGEVG
jgi:hypothetical protein